MSLTDQPEEHPKRSGFRLEKLLPVTTVGVILAALYVAWTFYSRHQSEVDAQRAAASKAQEQRERTVKAVFGSGEISVQHVLGRFGHAEAGRSYSALLWR